MEDGKRCLRQELVVDAPLAKVWAAFTTEEGVKGWIAPIAEVDFRLGGTLRTQYNAKAEIGHPGTVTLHYVNYVPHRLITLQAELGEQWPEEVRGEAGDMYNVIEFEAMAPARTRIVSWGVGYGTSETWDRMLELFVRGNEWSYGMLVKSLAEGPVDWSKIEVPGVSE